MGVFVREDGRLRPGWRITFYLGVYLFGTLVSQVIVLGAWSVTMLRRGQVTGPQLMERLLALNLPLQLFAALKAVDLLWVLLLTWLFGRFVDRRRLATFGLQRATGWLDDIILGLVLGTGQMVAIVGIAWLAGWVKVAPLPYSITPATLKYAVWGLLLFVLVAVGEELVFRGYVQTNLAEASDHRSASVGDRPEQGTSAGADLRIAAGSVRDRPEQSTNAGADRVAGSVEDRPEQATGAGASHPKSARAGLQTVPARWSAGMALAVSSILFGLFHALNPNLTGLAMLNLVLAGAALGMGYWATGSLWLPIAYHLSWNFIQGSILGLPVSGVRYGGLVMIADWGKAPLLTGHAFGPEGGLLGTAMLLGTVAVFWWWGRSTGRAGDRKGGSLEGAPHR